eukprot:gnl/Spiro4/10716_TR5708_c0_g1_i1.p1 gnl/Spiro4/10716_TR5708_c0_g1~~gnl/Spiro4/10716_TR5708_c0_g1_i1.p1  ORF type:complete len:394 (+),score=51.88 gnl/Spiro4/10716_TR5708_c0_g1_i1:145-1326(+)
MALLPPMGWSTWNTFACNVSEKLILDMADILVSSGMRDAGYIYVNIDDCWMQCHKQAPDGQSCYSPLDGRDPHTGVFVPDPVKFPRGIKFLADSLHEMGLKFGIYSSSGPRTCSGFMGSWGFEELDAATFASWGVDFLKLDCCNTSKAMKDLAYPRMSRALLRTGAPIVFSCDTDELFANPIKALKSGERPFEWGPAYCNMYRTGPDVKDNWLRAFLNANLNSNWWDDTKISHVSGPGRWNDPDMMVVGMGGQSLVQYRTLMALWAIQASPLIAGNDLRVISKEVLALLTNKGTLSVNQDRLAAPGHRIANGLVQVWSKPLIDGSVAVLLLNVGVTADSASVRWAQIGLPEFASAQVTDVWSGALVGRYNNTFSAHDIAPFDSVFVRIALVEK